MLVEKYAHMLTMRDFIGLYKKLEETVGNRSLTARKCGIERRTIYGWDTTKEIRLKTRERILSVLLEDLTEETLDFLTRRSVESSIDVLRTYLSSLYEKAMNEETSNHEFGRLASKFDQTRRQYEGLIDDNLQPEISTMMQYTFMHAKEIGVPFKPLPSEIVRLTEFSHLMPDLVKTISVSAPYLPTSEIAKLFSLPIAFVNAFATALHDNYIAIRAIEPVQTTAYPLLENKTATMATLTPTTNEIEEQITWLPGLTPRTGGAT
jgi:hypothetical protein